MVKKDQDSGWPQPAPGPETNGCPFLRKGGGGAVPLSSAQLEKGNYEISLSEREHEDHSALSFERQRGEREGHVWGFYERVSFVFGALGPRRTTCARFLKVINAGTAGMRSAKPGPRNFKRPPSARPDPAGGDPA
ncbi:hypothetical protein SKAU_G00045700 [Synaphobranchus kaupii]|uniref:Uncharacterized protein n=1 Tax=Synaphobranchus kaupii TaxID=118154 RepID=A0A9Q1G254_SYNKA|nr:hypothetical protein SKAU_G00045700 [Synaphobranchus kaupii]